MFFIIKCFWWSALSRRLAVDSWDQSSFFALFLYDHNDASTVNCLIAHDHWEIYNSSYDCSDVFMAKLFDCRKSLWIFIRLQWCFDGETFWLQVITVKLPMMRASSTLVMVVTVPVYLWPLQALSKTILACLGTSAPAVKAATKCQLMNPNALVSLE